MVELELRLSFWSQSACTFYDLVAEYGLALIYQLFSNPQISCLPQLQEEIHVQIQVHAALSRNTHHPYLLPHFITHKNCFVFLFKEHLVAYPPWILNINYKEAKVKIDYRSEWFTHLQVAAAIIYCMWILDNFNL